MIFNRLAGLDIGEPPTYLIPENIVLADAPTRYPFLWNAAIQDKTQWPGFADNGNNILGLSRNLGEVYGVFGDFHPVEQSGIFRLNRDYLATTRPTFSGLLKLEELVWRSARRRWPWSSTTRLAAKGAEIYNRDIETAVALTATAAARRDPARSSTRPGRRRSWMSEPTPGNAASSAAPCRRG